jgi:hypothetical protein
VNHSFLARAAVVLALALVPLRIVGQGFLPTDDALRHAAKAVSGRAWSEVLVLRPEVTMDSHPGWHGLLSLVHQATGVDAHALVLFSVTVLLLALLLPAAFLMRRPEAWALALVALGTLDPRLPARFASGRPFVLSAALLVVLCLLLSRGGGLPPPRRVLPLLAVLFGLVAFVHPSWHLFLLPVVACALAGRLRLGATLLAGLALGVLLAGILHGNPLEFVAQSVLHSVLAFGTPAPPGTLAIEFLPGDGSPMLVLGAVALLLWRALRGRWSPAAVENPVFALAVLGWLLGWLVIRFWSDWGAVALLVWMALELETMLEQLTDPASRRRVALAVAGGLAALLVLSANARGGRATPPERSFLSLTATAADPYLPEPGGILYTDDMRLFFQVFYARPTAPWRYVVGYEPALMPPDDLATFRRVLAARTPASFAPWVRKMTPADRLVLQSTEGRPQIPELEWAQVSQTLWSGRVPRPPAP